MRTAIRLSLAGLIALAAAPSTPAQIQFQSFCSNGVATAPEATALADVDGDGDLDLVVSAENPARLEVLLNLGDATFPTRVSVPVAPGGRPVAPVAVDLDGDGDVDLAVTLENLGLVELYENSGGAFQLAGSFAVQSGPRRIVAGDLDMDGDFDLVVLNQDSSSLTIAENLGGFGFGTQHVSIPGSPRELVLAELAGDALVDIAVTSIATDTLTVLVNGGAAGFSPLPISLGGLIGHSLAAGDVDQDGDTDLVTTGGGSFSYGFVVRNQGGGVFQPDPFFTLFGGGIGVIVLSDLDLDGDLDLALASAIGSGLVTGENDGTGTFVNLQTFGPAIFPSHIVAGDLNGDGSPELTLTDPIHGAVGIAINAASGTPCAVDTYCVAKINSLGRFAAIGAANLPSVGAQGFSIHMADAVPGNTTIAFFGAASASVPFMNGTLCVAPAVTRLAPQVITSSGTASYAIHVTTELTGIARFYQFWYRDPAHPDGTGTALSDGLRITPCD